MLVVQEKTEEDQRRAKEIEELKKNESDSKGYIVNISDSSSEEIIRHQSDD